MGLGPTELGLKLITLPFSSLTIYPLLYKDVARTISGFSPNEHEFKGKWFQFLKQIFKRE